MKFENLCWTHISFQYFKMKVFTLLQGVQMYKVHRVSCGMSIEHAAGASHRYINACMV